ncbi:MAG: hypothetical protein FWF54_00930 [Candidatus Azobacteroides sp.]|nr:hypothetical protein [Candidatus Azobacteroides sp.]
MAKRIRLERLYGEDKAGKEEEITGKIGGDIGIWRFGYGRTCYGNAGGPDGKSNAQTVGSITAFWRGGSFSREDETRKFPRPF